MIMRKTSLILFGAAAGVAVTLIATQPRIMLEEARAQATDADTYRQLSLFGDIFERLTASMGSGRIDLPRTSHETCASDAPRQVQRVARPFDAAGHASVA